MKTQFLISLLILLASCNSKETSKEINNSTFHLTESGYRGYSLEREYEILRNWSHDERAVGGDVTRYMYLNMSSFWYHQSITRKGQIMELPKVPNLAIETTLVNTRNGEMTLKEYVHGGLVDGLVILHKGTIIYEAYPRMFEFEKHAWFSVTKTLVSVVVGILEDRGLIDINLPIENYLEESKNTNWEGTTVRDILDMPSGIDCIEDVSSPETCFFKIFGQAVGWPFTEMESENPLEVFLGIPRHRPPGEVFEYATINTQILTYLIERVTNESFNDFLEREIWQKIGAESDGLMMTSKKGHAHTDRGM